MSTLQNTFNKHLRLLRERLQLNEGYSGEQIVRFFNKLKTQLTAKGVDYNKFIEAIKGISEENRDYYAETADRMQNDQLDMDQLMSFKEQVYDDGVDFIYEYDDDIIQHMITVLVTWRHANQDYNEKHDEARGDMDTISQLDMHPGMDFTEFLNHAKNNI